MSTNELYKLLNHLPVDPTSDLVRYGIEVIELPIIEYKLMSVPDEPAEVVPVEDCEVIDLFTEEVVIHEYPVGADWCEIISHRNEHVEEEHRGKVTC